MTPVMAKATRRARRQRPAPAVVGYGVWLTAASAAHYLDFTASCKEPTEAFRRWAKRAGIVPAFRGDVPLYARADLDRAIWPSHPDRG